MIRHIKIPIIFILAIFILITWTNFFVEGHTYSYDKVQQATGEILYLDKPLQFNLPLYYVSGRLFIPLKDFCAGVGASIKSTDDEGYTITWNNSVIELPKDDNEVLTYPLYIQEGNPYISLYDIGQLFQMAVVFDSKNNKVFLYNRELPQAPDEESIPEGKAYIRLEDISAEGPANAKVNENWEKMRTMADYFYSKGQHFYIAWIPRYVNPALNMDNDLTTDFNFYNADFLYTMDYMINHNGHIVLHGYTHQSGDTISGVGIETGKDSPFTLKEIEERFIKAKETAKELGYDDSMFNFPHYFSTRDELKLAEKYFDVIYQQSMYARHPGKIDRVNKFGHIVKYVPTPVGYVPTPEDLPATLEKIDNLPSSQIASMFFHPYVDFKNILISNTPDGVRHFEYNENGIIPQLIKKLEENGLAFSPIE